MNIIISILSRRWLCLFGVHSSIMQEFLCSCHKELSSNPISSPSLPRKHPPGLLFKGFLCALLAEITKLGTENIAIHAVLHCRRIRALMHTPTLSGVWEGLDDAQMRGESLMQMSVISVCSPHSNLAMAHH